MCGTRENKTPVRALGSAAAAAAAVAAAAVTAASTTAVTAAAAVCTQWTCRKIEVDVKRREESESVRDADRGRPYMMTRP